MLHTDFVFVEFTYFNMIDQKRVQGFPQGFQTPRNELKHDAEGGVLLLFRCVWNP